MKPEISIIVPGIRPHNWKALYDSVKFSTKRTFELIFVGPFEPPLHFRDIKNIKYIKDWGSPVRAQQIGATLAEGEFITWAADDAVYINNSLDVLINELKSEGDIFSVVIGKYYEGVEDNFVDYGEHYYQIGGNTWTVNRIAPTNWWLFNVGMMYTEFFNQMGGWDCKFETTFFSHTDLAMRVQILVAPKVRFIPVIVLNCSHMPDRTGDHGPIHDAHEGPDFNYFQKKYNVECNNTSDIAVYISALRISLNNWKEVPNIWERRFGKSAI